MNRILYHHIGPVNTPLVILMGGIHGNEPAGIQAIEMLIHYLQPDKLMGSVVGFLGNTRAAMLSKRYIDYDLNRVWTPDHIDNRTDLPVMTEDIEVRELTAEIKDFIKLTQPSEIYFLDLHTTSSDGGIFCIVPDETNSIKAAQSLGVPVVYDLLKNVQGTTLQYFSESNLGIPTASIAFEGGHHKDPFSVYRCFAFIMRYMSYAGLEEKSFLTNNQYDHILDIYFEKLPSSVSVKYRYPVMEARFFEMKPGFKHYQVVKQDEVLARYDGERITAPMSGMILMPLYQKQGSDGFFIVEG
jgi:succinylglutamate desuccinylase